MRNLKKHLSVLLVVAMIFSMMAPVFAVSSSYQASYEDEAERLNNLGLFKGVSDEEFDPALGSSLSREQAAIILLRLCGQEQEAQKMSPAEVNSVLARFTDANEISSWARNQVAYATSRGVIEGFPSGEFRPLENVTGKQYASLLLREIGITDFEYVGALEKLASLDVITVSQMISLDKDLLRDDVVCMSYNILDVETENGNTVIENLIDKGLVDRDIAEEYGLVEAEEPEEPGEEPEEPGEEPEEPTEEVATVEYKPTASRTLSAGQKLFQIGTVSVTAGDEDVNVTGLKLQKTGMSEDAIIKNVTVWSGSEKLNTVGRFNNGLANIAFTKLVTVEAGQTAKLVVKVDLDTNDDFAGTPEFSIALTEVKSDADLQGNFPMAGNKFTVTSVELGTMNVKKSGDAPTASLNAGDTNVRLAKFDVTFNDEAQTLKQVKLTQEGNIADSDIANLTLADDKEVLATADRLTNGAVTFNFEKEYASGTTARLTLRGDVIGGAGRNVRFVVDDDNDIQSVGKVYGSTIVATIDPTALQGSELSIEKGNLVISKDTSSPVSATIATDCSDQKFASIKIEAIGEPVQIEDVAVRIDGTGAIGKIDKVKVLNGDLVIASESKVQSRDLTLSLSEIVTVTPGTPVVLDITADLKEAEEEKDYTFGVEYIKGTGLVSAKDVKNEIKVMGSKMKVGDVKLTVEEIAAVDGYIFPNQASKELVKFELYHNVGEDVKLTSLTVDLNDNESDTTAKKDKSVEDCFSNIRLVSENGTVVSDPVNNPDSQVIKVSLKDGVIVSAGQTVKLSLIADVKSTANETEHEFEFSANGGVAVNVMSGVDVKVDPMDSSRTLTVDAGVKDNSISAEYSVSGDLENKNILANTEKEKTDLKRLAQWTLKNKSNEAVNVNKIYLTATYGGVKYETNPEYDEESNPTAEPTIAVDAVLKEAYINKYSLKDGKGNTLATFSTLPNEGKREVILTNKLEIPAAEDGKDGEVELVVWANVEKGAQYAGTISVKLGDNNGNYGEVTGTVSGNTHTITSSEAKPIEAGEDGELVNTVAISNVTAHNETSIQSSVLPGSKKITVGKFKLTNNGPEAVLMKNIRVYFSKDTSEGLPEGENATSNPITGLELYNDGKLIGGNEKEITLDSDGKYVDLVIKEGKKIAAKESQTFEIRLKGNDQLDNGETIQLRVDDKGTTYDSVSKDGYRISIDSDVTLTEVQAKD